MNCFLLSSISLVILLVDQSQGGITWEQSANLFGCCRTVTLELFKNFSRVVLTREFKKAQTDFESMTKPRGRQLFAFFHNEISDKEGLKKIIAEAEKAAGEVINAIIASAKENCRNSTIRRLTKEFTAKFKEGRVKCGDTKYLDTPITQLEQLCPESIDVGYSNKLTSYLTHKSEHHFYNYGYNNK